MTGNEIEKAVLELTNDDYYLLWEVEACVQESLQDIGDDLIKDVVVDLVERSVLSCFKSLDLSNKGIRLLTLIEAVEAVKDNANWAIPDDGPDEIVRVTYEE